MSAATSGTLLRPIRRKDRPRVVTGVFFVMCMVVLLGAFASRNNLLYWFVGMAIGAVLAHGLTAGPPMMRVFLGRVDVPRRFERGQSKAARLQVMSRNRFRVARAIHAQLDLVGSDGGRVTARGGLAAISPGETTVITMNLEIQRRGVYEIDSVRLKTTFPFGLSTKELVFRPGGRVVCSPSDAGISSSERRQLQQPATRHAADTDLGDIREYVRGDPRRLIAWRAAARARRPLVRDHQFNRSRKLWIRCRSPRPPLLRREPHAEAMLDRAAAIGKHAAQLNYQVGILHEPSGTRTIAQGGVGWLDTLASLGDSTGIREGAGPQPGDLIVDVAPSEPTRQVAS
ncbi:MAG: DUF58 domain-containing protein [Planctomycetota bacterium]